MKIEIELTSEEITKIVIEHLQPMFPGKYITKYITREIRDYGTSSHFVVEDKKPEETVEEENNNANTKNQ